MREVDANIAKSKWLIELLDWGKIKTSKSLKPVLCRFRSKHKLPQRKLNKARLAVKKNYK